MAALAASMGIQYNASTASADPDDFPVLAQGLLEFRDLPGQVAPQPKMASAVLREFYALSEDELEALQRKLFQAGFYPGDVDEEDIDFRNHDETTIKAYKTAVSRAGAFLEAGKKVTLDDVLSKPSSLAAKAKKGRERDPFLAVVESPEDIRKGVEAVARKAIGRKLTDDERERFVGFYQQLQTQRQQQAYNAQLTGGVVSQAPTLATVAEGFVRQEDPQGAYDIDALDQLGEFGQLLRETGG